LLPAEREIRAFWQQGARKLKGQRINLHGQPAELIGGVGGGAPLSPNERKHQMQQENTRVWGGTTTKKSISGTHWTAKRARRARGAASQLTERARESEAMSLSRSGG